MTELTLRNGCPITIRLSSIVAFKEPSTKLPGELTNAIVYMSSGKEFCVIQTIEELKMLVGC